MTEFFQWLINLLKEFRFYTMVMPWELAVRTRAGNRVKVWKPGFHLKLPFIDAVNIVNTRTRISHSPTQTITTTDGKTVSIAYSLGFSIHKPVEALLRFQDPEFAFAALIMSSTAKYIAAKSSKELVVEEIAANALTELESDAGGIIQIDFVRVCDFAVARTYRLLQEQWRPATGTGERAA